MSVLRSTIPVLFLLASTIGCERRPRIPTYQLVDNVPILTSRTADDAILLASDYCEENGIDLRQREMPAISYDTLDGVGYWCVLYHGLTRKPGDHFMLLIRDTTGEIEYVPGA
ncbi:hypothetical protein [Roseiconus lacunae]|uniref:Lipoprotein n=1 Tax=Roseiconus lacunae TaxID=2605694 RepID=A0ABT7PF73_9BACT|nr:hypothetical protein [Roseiconus lacunae]MDM4015149.1 hypothetical protein [Roseiconus lacunae]